MKLLTPFGKALRKHRIDHGETQMQVANGLGISVAFLSALETGTKNVPGSVLTGLAAHFRLSTAQVSELKRLAIASQKEVKINLERASNVHRELAAGFARRFADLNAGEIEQLRNVLKMKGDGK